MNKKMWKRSILSALLAGMWCAGSVAYAEVIDMTAPENLGGVVIDNLTSTVKNTYLYKWDSATGKVIGGTILNKKVRIENKDIWIYSYLVLDASDFPNLNAREARRAADELIKKITESDEQTNPVSISIRNEKGEELYRYDVSNWIGDDPDGTHHWSHEYRIDRTLKETYFSPLINDGTVHEYDQNAYNDDRLPVRDMDVYPDFSNKAEDNIYALVRTTDYGNLKVLTWMHGGHRDEPHCYWWGRPIRMNLKGDASMHPDGRAYGIYNDSSKEIHFGPSSAVFDVKGAEATGIYAGNNREGVKSSIQVYGNLLFNLDGSRTTGVEAGKNGEVVDHIYIEWKQDPNPINVDVRSPHGYGLYAHDGGVIRLGKATVSSGLADAVYAERGGRITFATDSYTGNLKTDGDENSHIRTTILKSMRGDALGHVGMKLGAKASWEGSASSLTDLTLGNDSVWHVGRAGDIRLPVLSGSNGNIHMNRGGGDLSVGSLEGKAGFSFERDAADATRILGGTVIIDKAAAGSIVTIFTDRTGLESAEEAVMQKVLRGLAEKLYYKGYMNGEEHITATAVIAGGLTSASIFDTRANLYFDRVTGRAKLENTSGVLSFTKPITFTEDDADYKTYGIASADYSAYTFPEKVEMNVDFSAQGTPIPENMAYANAIWARNAGDHVIDLKGNDLALNVKVAVPGMSQVTSTSISQMQKGTLTIKNPGFMDISNWTDFYYAGGISAGGRFNTYEEEDRATVHIMNDNSWDHRVKITGTVWGMPNGSPTNTSSIFWINFTGIKTFDHGNVFIDGLVDIDTNDAWCVSGIGGHSIISLGGGSLNAKHYTSVDSYSDGTVNINIANGQQKGEAYRPGNNKVNIQGNLRTQGQWVGAGSGGYINVALTTPDSTFNGRADSGSYAKQAGWTSLWLQNGATWTNQDGGFQYGDKWNYNTKEDSVVEHFIGGGTEETRGVIYQKYGAPADSLKPEREKGASDLYLKNYSGHTLVLMDHSVDEKGQISIDSGKVQIDHAHKDANGTNAVITLRTDNAGLTGNSPASAKNIMSETLHKLANKLYYTAYKEGERNLTGKVEIAEGLTAQSASMRVEDITYKDENGQGQYLYTPAVDPADQQDVDTFDTAITGDAVADEAYVAHGVLKNNIYTFTRDGTTIRDAHAVISGGAIPLGKIAASISNSSETAPTIIDMNHHRLNIHSDKFSIAAGDTLSGIAATTKGSRVEINNAGPIDIQLESYTSPGHDEAFFTAGIFVNTGGVVHIHNGGENKEDKVLRIRSAYKPDWTMRSAGIKARNSMEGVYSTVQVDGLVDIEVDGDISNETAGSRPGYGHPLNGRTGVSATGSQINIGGGSVKVRHGFAALWAHGEFQSANDGIIRMNVERDSSGNVIGAGKNRTIIEGDVSTRATHGKGRIYLGLSTPESYWLGSYPDKNTFNQPLEQLGSVDLFIKNGAYWKGFSDGVMHVTIEDGASSWTGFNMGDNMHLILKNGATWYNAITKDQKDLKDNPADSKVKNLVSDKGIIDMTGARAFMGSWTGERGKPSSSLTEMPGTETGNLIIGKYSGNGTVIYRHVIEGNAPKVLGGNTTILSAEEDSVITLRTDNEGLNTSSDKAADKNLVSETLNALAGKLFYPGQWTGSKNHLTGKVEIAEGLTASAAGLRIGDITYKFGDGQGQYLYTPATDIPDEQIINPMKQTMDGSVPSEKAYTDAGIYKAAENTYRFTKDPAEIQADTAISAGTKDLKVNAEGRLVLAAKDRGILAESHNVDITAKTLDVMAANGTAVTAGNGTVKIHGNTRMESRDGIKAQNGSTVTIDGRSDITAEDTAIEALGNSKVSLTNGGTIKGKIRAAGGRVETKDVEAKGDIQTSGAGFLSMTGGKIESGRVEAEGTGSSIALRRGEYNIEKLKADNGSSLTLINNPDKKTEIREIEAGAGSSVSTTLEGEKAALIGDITGTGEVELTLGDKARWEGKSNNGKADVTVDSIWKNTGKTKLRKLGGSGTVDMTQSGEGKTEIGEYNGSVTLVYAHDNANPVNIKGNNFHIGKAAAGSKVRMLTDSEGLNTSSGKAADKNLVSETLNALAGKLYYEAYKNGEKNLAGTVEIAEGLTAQSATKRLETMTYKAGTGQGQYLYTPATEDNPNPNPNPNPKPNPNPNPNPKPKPPIIYGSKETQMMKGAKTAMTSAVLLWRGNNNDLQRRMGDIRLAKEENGIWARYLGGKNKLDKQNTYLKQTYDIAQVGYDKKKGNWTIGAALDYGTGKDTYANGTGKGKLASLALYGTMQKEDGQYIDVILKGSHIKNDYTVYNEMNHRLEGKYRTNGLSLSMEYGKRMKKENGFYIDPSIELTAGHLGGKDYDAVSDYAGGKKMHIHQDGINSVIGRIGLGIGKETERSNLFAKIALAHEFGGKVKSIFSAENEPTSGTEVELKDSWVDVEVGGSWLVNRNTYLYGTYTRNFGADVSSKWRIDAGIRFSF